MGFRVFICIALIGPQPVLAKKKVWVRSLYSSGEDFQIFLNTHSGQSYAEYQLQQSRQKAKSFQIKEKLISAQQFYLEGREQEAKEAFLEISHQAYLADWDTEERRIFIYTFLRLAQFEKNKQKQQAFLILAQHFLGSPITKENYSDFELFPPPLMNRLKEIQAQSPILTLPLGALFPNHEILLLNGERIDKRKVLKRFQAHYRLTALSSSHKPWSKKVNLSKLLFQKIPKQSLTEGACPYAQLKTPLKNPAIEVAPASRCPEKNPLPGLTGTSPSGAGPSTASPEKSAKKPSEESQEAFKDKKLWLTIGAGVVILSLIFFLGGQQDKESPDTEPIF